jgi:hypothetical protein
MNSILTVLAAVVTALIYAPASTAIAPPVTIPYASNMPVNANNSYTNTHTHTHTHTQKTRKKKKKKEKGKQNPLFFTQGSIRE